MHRLNSKLKLYNYFYITYYKKEELIFDSLPWQKGEPVRSLAFWIAKTSHPVVNNARRKMHPPTIGWNHSWRSIICFYSSEILVFSYICVFTITVNMFSVGPLKWKRLPSLIKIL